MKISQAKENILKKIRQALTHSTPLPFAQSEGNSQVFEPSGQELEVEFAEQFTKLLGKFVYCQDHGELVRQLKALKIHEEWSDLFCQEAALIRRLGSFQFSDFSPLPLKDCQAALTTCECLVARTGSILLSSAQESGTTVSVYAPIHLCVAYSSQLVYDLRDGLQRAREKYRTQMPSLLSLATGPSRTADIEKTLVVGVHGPKEVYVFLVDEDPQGL
jgi:L-lactate dehydrogenase complex protein LldG